MGGAKLLTSMIYCMIGSWKVQFALQIRVFGKNGLYRYVLVSP